MDEDTEAFLARHRSNTNRYMSKLNITKDSPERLDVSATLKRLQDKYGLTPERKDRIDEVRVSVDEQNIKDFIKSVRMKYLGEKEAPVLPANDEKLTEKFQTRQLPIKEPIIVPEKTKPQTTQQQLQPPTSPKPKTTLNEPLIDLSSPIKQPLDLLTGNQPNDLLTLSLSPRKPPSSPSRSPIKETAKLSPKTDGLISHFISSAISKRLGLCKKLTEKQPKALAKLRDFDTYLAAKRISPMRTTPHRSSAPTYKSDPELEGLLKKEQALVERLR